MDSLWVFIAGVLVFLMQAGCDARIWLNQVEERRQHRRTSQTLQSESWPFSWSATASHTAVIQAAVTGLAGGRSLSGVDLFDMSGGLSGARLLLRCICRHRFCDYRFSLAERTKFSTYLIFMSLLPRLSIHCCPLHGAGTNCSNINWRCRL